MKRTIRAAMASITVGVTCTLILVSAVHAGGPLYGMPSAINPAANYLFFFHNYYVEMKGTDGDCKYYDILNVFTEKGFTVISEIRPKDSSVVEYAKKATVNIHKLLDAGVPSENITVAGHSKGGVIAIQISSLLGKPNVKYLILAGCGIKGLDKAYPDYSSIKGNILSVYATSDKVAGSCGPILSQSRKDISSKEIVLERPEGHQLFFSPRDVWVEPVMRWIQQGM